MRTVFHNLLVKCDGHAAMTVSMLNRAVVVLENAGTIDVKDAKF